MGGGQLDCTPIISNSNISAVLWAGVPGQDGGTAIFDILTGKYAPAGRLPTTQYPAEYISQVPATDMNLRPGSNSPGRTYKWYSGKPVFPFGFGLHYTDFSASVPSNSTSGTHNISSLISSCQSSNATKYLDQCTFVQIPVQVSNTGKATSDYVALGFLAGEFGPTPYPNKALVNYQRLFNITAGSSQTAFLNLTLASLSRVDANGNRMLYPGSYSLQIDTQPLATVNFTLTGAQAVLDQWPQRPTVVPQTDDGNYFVGGFGTLPQQVSNLNQRGTK